MTVSGRIEFERTVWQCAKCRRSHAPVDAAMNVEPGGKWTRGVERKAAFAAAASPFSGAATVLRELAGLDVSSSEVDRIAQAHGSLLDERQRLDEARWLEPLDPSREVPRPQIACEKLVFEADAASVLTVSHFDCGSARSG